MSEFQQFWWYIGVCMTVVTLLLSVVTRNWVLTVLCTVSTARLRRLNDKVELPKVYTQKGIKDE